MQLQPNGALRDIAPTMLSALGQPQPKDMTGRDLRIIK
jgi:bisphosphoglycerate-independent phosphoglycerate mutase (AlkP superfamily)